MRRAFRKRVVGLSLTGGVAVCTLVCLASFLARLLSVSEQLGDTNQQTLSRISCREAGRAWTERDERSDPPICDISAIETDPAFENADYVLDRFTRYFLYNGGRLPGFWLDKSDVTFLRQFHEPKSITLETGERWRIYSEPAEIDGRRIEVMVGEFESAPWAIGESAVGADVDEQLRAEARRIVQQARRARISSRAFGWQVVDDTTGDVHAWSGNVPALYPTTASLKPWMFHFQDGQVWLARTTTTERLEAVSVQSLGSAYGFVLLGLAALSLGTLATYPMAKKFVRTGIAQPASLDDALGTGESETVEFKQEVKERQSLLKDITAFANSRGGTVFIGIVDGTMEILGVDAVMPDRRDAFERGLRDSIRNSIEPSPQVIIDYPQKKGCIIPRIFVLAGREAHSFEGRYYVREGSQSRYVTDGEITRL